MFVFFQAEDGIRDLVRSRGLGDVYKRQAAIRTPFQIRRARQRRRQTLISLAAFLILVGAWAVSYTHLTLPTSDLV